MRKTMLVTVQGQKRETQMCHAELFVLTDNQYKKCEKLTKSIDNLAKDYHVNWAVEHDDEQYLMSVSITTTDVIDDNFCHQFEINAANFMSAIDKMELPKEESECPARPADKEKEQDAETDKTLEFVKKLLSDINSPSDDNRHVVSALIIDTTTHPIFTEPTAWGRMSHDLLKEMCELYLAAHENK